MGMGFMYFFVPVIFQDTLETTQNAQQLHSNALDHSDHHIPLKCPGNHQQHSI